MSDADDEPPVEVTLVVETQDGIAYRQIPAAMPLAQNDGTGAEQATRAAASVWGMPDFVFESEVEQKSSKGRREVSDGVIFVDEIMIVLQSKRRDEPGEKISRERSWLLKHARIAAGQAAGTFRRMSSGEPVSLTNRRGRRMVIEPPDKTFGVVLLDHPNPPDNLVPDLPASDRLPQIAMLRRDWEFLFDQLRSTVHVCRYVARVAMLEPVALGAEPGRYYELALADEAAGPGPTPRLLGRDVVEGRLSEPLLPLAPVVEIDEVGHVLFRQIMEDLANSEIPDGSERDLVKALSLIDSTPAVERQKIARVLMERLVAVEDAPRDTFRFRHFAGGRNAPLLVFATATRLTDENKLRLEFWLRVRHHEHWEEHDFDGYTVLVLLTPVQFAVDDRVWDTTMMALMGDPGVSADDLELAKDLFGKDPAD